MPMKRRFSKARDVIVSETAVKLFDEMRSCACTCRSRALFWDRDSCRLRTMARPARWTPARAGAAPLGMAGHQTQRRTVVGLRQGVGGVGGAAGRLGGQARGL